MARVVVKDMYSTPDVMGKCPLVLTPDAVEDFNMSEDIGGALFPKVVRILDILHSKEVPVGMFPSHWTHRLDGHLSDFHAIATFPADSIWFNSNHPARTLRAVFRHCSLPGDLELARSIIRQCSEFVKSLAEVARVNGVGSWEQLPSFTFVLCICRAVPEPKTASNLT